MCNKAVYIHRDPCHLHFVSYGLSNLYYDEEAVGGEFSGWGFELTFRLALELSELPREAEGVPYWPMGLMQNLARYVFNSQKWFEHGHYIDAKGPIKAGASTDKTAIIFCNDPELAATETPHGRLDFLQMVGINASEFGGLQANDLSAETLIGRKKAGQPLLITSLAEE
ncbi:suppressor of fused domain protein [uncultured Ruegeria sp.]|uniref:suppressor of fused domain protein n=1 Tax=uncultured Ruegeria sp. TaxID=259304 RepID=UPI00262416CE|nr:suppressor of fused domain protein [uncultured Ruegeria sp.]